VAIALIGLQYRQGWGQQVRAEPEALEDETGFCGAFTTKLTGTGVGAAVGCGAALW